MNTVEMNTTLPVENITTAIVTAAKRSVKKDAVIVTEIVEQIRAGSFPDETVAKLMEIFGHEFCVKKGFIAKEKKPRAKKTPAATEEPKEPKEPTEPTEPTEPKEKKPRAKKVKEVVTPTDETPVVTTEEPKEPKEKKPRAKKVKEVVMPTDETPVVTTTEESKEKKPRAKKVKEPTTESVSTNIDISTEIPITFEPPEVVIEVNEQQYNTRQDGFSDKWSEELVEEELSEIEEEDDDDEEE